MKATTEVVKLFKDDYDRILGTFSSDINFQRNRCRCQTRQLANDWNDTVQGEDSVVSLKRKTKMLQIATRGLPFFVGGEDGGGTTGYHDPQHSKLKHFEPQELIFPFQATSR